MMIEDIEASKTSKFARILNNIRLEIMAPIPPPTPPPPTSSFPQKKTKKLFLEVSALLAVRHCSKPQFWAISFWEN